MIQELKDFFTAVHLLNHIAQTYLDVHVMLCSHLSTEPTQSEEHTMIPS